MQINFIINRIYKHRMDGRNCSFNPPMFIARIFSPPQSDLFEGLISIHRSSQSISAASSIIFGIASRDRIINARECAEFVQNLWKWSVNAIWHNFQRIIPQIKKSIIFLLYGNIRKYKFAYYSFGFFFSSPSFDTSLSLCTQSSTPSSIIFINVTFFLQQQKPKLSTAIEFIFNFSFSLTRRSTDGKEIIFAIVNFPLAQGISPRRKIFFNTEAEKYLIAIIIS